MSKNKKRSNSNGHKKQAPQSKQAAKTQSSSKRIWIIGGVIAVVLGAILIASGAGSGGDTAGSSAPEDEYVGRLLPEGYETPQVADLTLYSSAISMTDVTATQDTDGFSIPLDSVVTNKLVRFDYQRLDGEILPMLAYVRPSGGLFVGVSYCPPCEGEGQRIESDGTLTCESCGTKRNLENNAGISGACRLYPLDEVPSTVSGDRITVDGSILDAWTVQPLDRPVG
jgi:hypothetical protein